MRARAPSWAFPYAVQLADKHRRCELALADAAPDVVWLEPFASAESAFRNKAKLVVGGRTGAVTLGILDADANGVDLRACGLHEQPLQQLIPRVAALVDEMGLEPYDVSARRGELKHVILTLSPAGAVMLRFVLRSRRHLALLESRLPMLLARVPEVAVVSVNLQPEHKAVLEGDTEIVLTSQDVLAMPVNGLTLNLRPNSFFQTNTAVAAGLYRQAQDWMREISPDAVLDLYCGVGGFALHAAQAGVGRVLGVEVSPDAVLSAERTARELRGGAPGRRRRRVPGGRRHRRRRARPRPAAVRSCDGRRQPAPPRHRTRPGALARAVRGLPRHLLELQRRAASRATSPSCRPT